MHLLLFLLYKLLPSLLLAVLRTKFRFDVAHGVEEHETDIRNENAQSQSDCRLSAPPLHINFDEVSQDEEQHDVDKSNDVQITEAFESVLHLLFLRRGNGNVPKLHAINR